MIAAAAFGPCRKHLCRRQPLVARVGCEDFARLDGVPRAMQPAQRSQDSS
jgi:hypothetical protein